MISDVYILPHVCLKYQAWYGILYYIIIKECLDANVYSKYLLNDAM